MVAGLAASNQDVWEVKDERGGRLAVFLWENDDWKVKPQVKHHLFVSHTACASYTGAQVLIKTTISAEQQSRVTWLTSCTLEGRESFFQHGTFHPLLEMLGSTQTTLHSD